MPCTCSSGRRRTRRLVALGSSILIAACSYAPAPAFPRPAQPLPAAVAAHYALPGPPALTRLGAVADGVADGELTCGAEMVHFHLHRAAVADRPVVLLVPILAGGEDLMRGLARRMTERGFHAAWCDRVAPALSQGQRGPDLEQLFVRTVLHQRALLDWLRHGGAGPEPQAVFALGVSLGGMVAAALAAVEPDLDGVAICLAGADIPSIVLDSGEARVEHWRRWRMTEDGLGAASLRQELQRCLQSDPARLCAFVPTEHVLLVRSSLDEVVRPAHQDLLWEALGRPRRLTVPLGHYASALAIDSIVDAVAGFFRDRQGACRLAADAAATP